jgi:serine/threonine protein kinase
VVKKVFDHTLKFKGVLGKGSFGVVGGFDDILSGKQLAVKTFNDALSWWKELCILGTISRSVKRSVWLERAGMFWDGGICYWWLAMPILHPLPTRVCQRDPNALDKLLWRMFATLLEGVAQLQHPSSLESNSGGCVHADIKPGNLLWDHSSQNLAVMLADFSLTTAAPQTLGRRFGTRFWRAPEVEDLTLNRTEVGWFQKTDVWSCGLVMLHMVLGGTRGPIRSLVHTHLELKEDEKPESEDIVRITKEHLPALLEDAKKQLVASLVPCPLKLWNHINHALSIDPVQRPSAADLFASVRESYLYVIRNIYTKKPDECLLSPSKRPAPSRRRSTRKRRIVCA